MNRQRRIDDVETLWGCLGGCFAIMSVPVMVAWAACYLIVTYARDVREAYEKWRAKRDDSHVDRSEP